MKRLIIFLLLFAAIKVAGQTTGYLRFDTVLIYKNDGTAELALMNATKDTLGVLVNYGNGRTRFMKSRAINDSTFVVGLDTITIHGGGSGGSAVTSISQGYGIVNTPNPITSTGTVAADSATLSGYYLRRKDSVLYTTVSRLIDTAQAIRDDFPSGSGGTPGGSDTHIQFNDAGVFGGDAGSTYNKTTNTQTTDTLRSLKARTDNLRIYEQNLILDSIRYHGTSITAGTGPSSNAHRFSTLTSNKLNALESNFGISGATLVTQGVANIPTLPVFDRAKYRWIILEWGVNDCNSATDSATFASTYDDYIDTLIINRGWPPERIVILAPSYINPTTFPTATFAKQLQFRLASQAIATLKGTKWVDVFGTQVARNPDLLVPDGIHPNDYGSSVYVNNISKVIGDSVMSSTQTAAINGLTEIQRLKIRAYDTSDYKSLPVGLDSAGNLVRFFKDDIIRNSNVPSFAAQASSINLLGRGYFGGVTPTAAEIVQVNGMIKGTSLRATGSSPTGLTGSGAELFLSGGVAGLMGYNRGASSALPLALNQLGGQVIVNTGTVSGGAEALFVSGGVKGSFGQFIGTLPGGMNGSGVEIGRLNGTTGYVGAYDRGGSSALTLVFNALGGNVGIQTTTPDRAFHIEPSNTATANAPYYIFRRSAQTSGTAAIGFGIGAEDEIENSSGTMVVAGRKNIAWTDATNASEDADYIFELVAGGSIAEKFRITSTGLVTFGGATSSFPALLRSSAKLVARLADNSANTNVEVLDEAYDATTWNGNNDVPTKNAVRDKIESLSSGLTSINSETGPAITIAAGTGLSVNTTTNTVTISANSSYFDQGTYTPTLTNTANIDASVAHLLHYYRVGNVVTVSGAVQIDATTTATVTQLRLTLPVASTFTDEFELAGTSTTTYSGGNEAATIRGVTSNGTAEIRFYAGDVANHTWFFVFTYRVTAP